MPALPDTPYLIAIAVLCVAAVAFWVWCSRRARRGSGGSAAAEDPTRSLAQMNGREFEALVRESFRLQGYLIVDGAEGSELTLRRDRETILVQCKHWQASRVGVEVVQALQRSMKARGAGGGFVLTTGRFSREAVAFAPACNVRLIDGSALRGLTERAQTAHGALATR